MGYEIEDTISVYKIEFGEDSPYHGLEVEVAGMTIGEYNSMLRGFLASAKGETTEEKAEANMASSDYIQEKFYSRIKSWNLTRKGKAVPVSKKEMEGLDSRLASVLVRRWMDELVTIPQELVGKSSDGEISPEQLQALASSSENHSS